MRVFATGEAPNGRRLFESFALSTVSCRSFWHRGISSTGDGLRFFRGLYGPCAPTRKFPGVAVCAHVSHRWGAVQCSRKWTVPALHLGAEGPVDRSPTQTPKCSASNALSGATWPARAGALRARPLWAAVEPGSSKSFACQILLVEQLHNISSCYGTWCLFSCFPCSLLLRWPWGGLLCALISDFVRSSGSTKGWVPYGFLSLACL